MSLLVPINREIRKLPQTQAWGSILALVLLTSLGAFGIGSKLLNLLFPATACLLGGFLYFRYPILYNGFSWWIWFLVAFVRRVVDLRVGYTDPSPILLTPHLVMGFTFITLFKQLPSSCRQGGLPFIFAFIGVLYGFCVALISRSVSIAIISLLDWSIPISYGFYLFVYWRDYPNYRQNLQNVFTWGVLVMGSYGIYQYLVAPAWDMTWLIDSKMFTANGYHDKAEVGPMAIRVFSTMHSIEPFSSVLTGGVLILLSTKNWIQFPASAVGYLSLLLTMMRSAWIGWLVGILTLFGSLKSKFQIRLIITFLVMIMCLLPIASMNEFSDNIGNRLQTLSNVKDDDSATGRQEGFEAAIGSALTSFVGQGISRESYDNTLLVLMFYLGWVGTLPYLGGLAVIVAEIFRSKGGRHDPFIGTTKAIVASILVRILVNNIAFGASSVLLWGFLGIGMAAVRYHQHQHILGETNVNNSKHFNS